MNQRAGKMHRAAMNDEGGGNISVKQLITFLREAQRVLEDVDECDAALRFEILGDFVEQDVVNGTPFVFTTRAIGL